ncbi:MAG: hypothetical protein IPH12_05020 [Saprospirales bacterium]|nr:hypothetical protein [Saprospirales bacterium]MBK8922980.1 hypothetical protein [Saprospirales bacterium]
MKTFRFFLAAFVAFSLLACTKNSNCGDMPLCPDAVSATFKNLTGLDGCGYVLQLADGAYLEVVNLSELNLTPADGMKVRVKYSPQSGMASICMVGPIVRVDCIEEVQK